MADHNDNDIRAVKYFLNLKQLYQNQRSPWEDKWRQALSAYHLKDDLSKVYEGRANISIPIIQWKVNGITARINRILFNVLPFGRLESKNKKKEGVKKGVIDLWNKYIFESQLDTIGFKKAFKQFVKNKTIEGTSVAKISQEFEEKEFTYFDDLEPEVEVIKDNTYFRNILLKEFYSDVNKEDINESSACIHSTVVPFQHLLNNEKKKELTQETFNGEVIETMEEVGVYKNLGLLVSAGDHFTDEQSEYIQLLGLNKGQSGEFLRSLKEIRKTGMIRVDECYGLYDLNGDGKMEEVLCTIAQGRVVIRVEATPFKHKRYVRPFIVGRSEPISNCLYGNSKVISSLNLLMELNASRAQSTDAKTRSISNMWYIDETKNVRWDKTWRPGGVVHGQGSNGLTPIINPNLSHISITDSELISRDLDQLWSLSPVQQGTSDSRLIPKTASGTQEIISQNDMPLNELIDNTIELELKPFIEMLVERNLVFKTVDDLLDVWGEQEIEKSGLSFDSPMSKLLFDFNIRILGNLELSNEVAHQNGWQAFINWAMTVPPVAKRIDWTAVAEKQLASFGIKDVSEGIWLPDEVVLEVDQNESANANISKQQNREDVRDDLEFQKGLDVEGEIVKMQNEAIIERSTGQIVQ